MFKQEIYDAFDVDAPVRKTFLYVIINIFRIKLRTLIRDHELNLLPCEAFIETEGIRVKGINDPTPYPNPDPAAIGFVNNGIMALFSSSQYLINTTKIEAIDNDVDVATTIIGLARSSDDFIRSEGHSMMFANNITDHADYNPFVARQPKNNTGAAKCRH